MQIFVKTLKGTHFDIKVNPDDTVADVKKNIESTQGQSVYPADQQMLIHQGKVLKDETTLAENNVAEKAFVVIMLRKGKGSSSGASTTTVAPSSQYDTAAGEYRVPRSGLGSPQIQNLMQISASAIPQAPSKDLPPAPSQAPIDTTPPTLGSTATNTTTEPALAPAPAPVPAPVPAPSPAITKANTANAYDQAASNLVAGSNLEQVIQQILDMGGGTWDRDSVIRAMRAAFNNPERAVEYLYSGIPEQADAPSVSQSHTAQAALVTNNPSTQAAQVTNNPSAQAAQVTNSPSAQSAQVTQTAIPSSVPNANPLNLFPQGLPSLGTNPGAGNLHFLRNSPQFRALQAMVQANPQILQPMLQELGRQNPQIMRLIQEHQAEFLRLLNEPAEGGEGNALGQLSASMPQALTVTPEERAAIERLEAMGFNRALVLQVFFACNKNEELAANYLLDHIHEFDD